MDVVKQLEKFSMQMQAIRWAPSTQENYLSQVKMFLYHFKDAARPKEIPAEDVLKYLTTKIQANTQRHAHSAIKAYYKMVVGQEFKFRNIPYAQKEKKLPQPLDESEVLGILKACNNLKHQTIISLLYGCGLRIGEVIDMKITAIDSKRMIINIVAGKGKKDRVVMLDSDLLELLRKYFKQYKPNTYLFNGQNNAPQYSERSINEFLKKYAAMAGITRPVHAHLLRHSFATHSLEHGTDISLIQKLLGHSSPKTTHIYTHVSTKLISKVPSPLSFLKNQK